MFVDAGLVVVHLVNGPFLTREGRRGEEFPARGGCQLGFNGRSGCVSVVCRRQTRVGGLFAENPSALFDGAGGESVVIHFGEWGIDGWMGEEGEGLEAV